MAAVLTILGARDPRLEELVRASGLISTVTWLSDLGTLLDSRAGQPDVLLVDVRQDGKLPGNLPAFKQQHPSTNVMLLGSAVDPALMLDGMRAGVTEFIAEPLNQGDFDAAMTRLLGQRKASSSAAPCSRSSAPRAESERRLRPSTLRRRWRSSPRARRCSSTCTWPTGMRPCSSAPMRGSPCWTRFENMHRLDAEFLKSLVVKTASGLDLLASADRPANRPVDVRRLGEVVQLAASHYAYTVLDVPRSDLTVLDSLDQVTNLVVVANQELATVRNAGRMAAALRARYPAPR